MNRRRLLMGIAVAMTAAIVWLVARIPNEVRKVQITQKLHLERPDKRVHIVFPRVRSDGSLVTGTFSGVNVRLRAACVDTPMQSDWFPYLVDRNGIRRADPCFGVELQVRAPGRLTRCMARICSATIGAGRAAIQPAA